MFSVEEVDQILKETLNALEADKRLAPPAREGLTVRLVFHQAFLAAVDCGFDDHSEIRKAQWRLCQETLKSVISTHELGVPVPAAFSTKIQRRLASTVPPRSIVEMGFNEASAWLERLCEDSIVVEDVLGCINLSSLVVRRSI